METKIGKALVVGAGISGMRAALDLAETGYKVILVDRAEHPGGMLLSLDHQFPSDGCGMCRMLPLVDRDSASAHCLRRGLYHKNIELLSGTELLSLEGEPGEFTARLRQRPRLVNADLCIACGKCAEACPVEVPDAFTQGRSMRKALHLPLPQAFGNAYVIDTLACTRCGACQEACPTGAIRIPAQEREKFRILVVDDELIVRSSLSAWLTEEAGFPCETAGSGEEALEKLGEGSYEAMFIDIKMPGMDGMEVLARAKEMAPGMSVIMMTAYATVETAVNAMKQGALDYLVKPFDAEAVLPKVLSLYEAIEASTARQEVVGAVVLAGGAAPCDPSKDAATLGWGEIKNVVTGLELERMISGSGPSAGHLARPDNGEPVRRVAWLQCVGSRDLLSGSDYCSSVCCMFAVKEAVLLRKKSKNEISASIFYMDMRAFEKPFQKYVESAESEHGVRFVRSRVHTVTEDPDTGECILRFLDKTGATREERYDLVVLSAGMRPSPDAEKLAGMAEVARNPFGFVQTHAFSEVSTSREGIFVAGAFSGERDIHESVIQASAAAARASAVIHGAGGGLAPVSTAGEGEGSGEIWGQAPRVLGVLCTCKGNLAKYCEPEELARALSRDPCVAGVEKVDNLCGPDGPDAIAAALEKTGANRVLIGACLGQACAPKAGALASKWGLPAACVDAVDLLSPGFGPAGNGPNEFCARKMKAALLSGLARLKMAEPISSAPMPVSRSALVAGGGIAGMSAALCIADHGFPVDLVEAGEELGGRLNILSRTLGGEETAPLLAGTMEKLLKHPLITVHTGSRVCRAAGRAGRFVSFVQNAEGEENRIDHGVAIIATGGGEAPVSGFGRGESHAVKTQMEMEKLLAAGGPEVSGLSSAVFLQCAGCRNEERDYCARVCCGTSLKQALWLKEQNPEARVFVLYRDMMAYGFMESYYTRARRAGIVFIRYEKDEKPEVEAGDGGLVVKTRDPILDRPLSVKADMLVLAAGVAPTPDTSPASWYGAGTDEFGFFAEADFKWRPVSSMAEGVFACGLALGPRNIPESIATAEAAASRSLAILSRESLQGSRITASVRGSLCSLCERCIPACPYNARFVDEDLGRVAVDPALCQGCGSCAVVCPNGASVLTGLRREQMLQTIDAAFA